MTQKVGKLPNFLLKQLFRWTPHQHSKSVTIGISSGNLLWHKGTHRSRGSDGVDCSSLFLRSSEEVHLSIIGASRPDSSLGAGTSYVVRPTSASVMALCISATLARTASAAGLLSPGWQASALAVGGLPLRPPMLPLLVAVWGGVVSVMLLPGIRTLVRPLRPWSKILRQA
jgi:hypothetical protein